MPKTESQEDQPADDAARFVAAMRTIMSLSPETVSMGTTFIR